MDNEQEFNPYKPNTKKEHQTSENKDVIKQENTEQIEQKTSEKKYKCPRCGAMSSGKFCPDCGLDLSGKICKNCGSKVASRFCENCGYDTTNTEIKKSEEKPKQQRKQKKKKSAFKVKHALILLGSIMILAELGIAIYYNGDTIKAKIDSFVKTENIAQSSNNTYNLELETTEVDTTTEKITEDVNVKDINYFKSLTFDKFKEETVRLNEDTPVDTAVEFTCEIMSEVKDRWTFNTKTLVEQPIHLIKVDGCYDYFVLFNTGEPFNIGDIVKIYGVTSEKTNITTINNTPMNNLRVVDVFFSEVIGHNDNVQSNNKTNKSYYKNDGYDGFRDIIHTPKDTVINNAIEVSSWSEINWEELVRNSGKYEGKYVKVSGYIDSFVNINDTNWDDFENYINTYTLTAREYYINPNWVGFDENTGHLVEKENEDYNFVEYTIHDYRGKDAIKLLQYDEVTVYGYYYGASNITSSYQGLHMNPVLIVLYAEINETN